MNSKIGNVRKVMTYLFLAVPLFFASFSIFHLIDFLALGNSSWLAIGMGITFEIANIVAVLIFVVLKKINKPFVWATFILLICMQIIGNVYSVFDYLQTNLDINAKWIQNYVKMVRYVTPTATDTGTMFWLAVMIGAISPIIALLLTKSVARYLGVGNEDEETVVEKDTVVKQPENSTIDNLPLSGTVVNSGSGSSMAMSTGDAMSSITRKTDVPSTPTISAVKSDNEQGHGIVVD